MAGTGPTPFRFYDNRQKYLAFVTTCNEKAVIAARCAEELARIRPTPPALRLFDAEALRALDHGVAGLAKSS